jgi:hypothetical protein
VNVQIFIAGFIGALAPEVVRLYQLRQNPQQFQSYYYIISLVYALLGGYVVTIMPGVSTGPLWWAFVVGTGLNAVVSLAAKYATSFMTPGGPAAPPNVPPTMPPGAESVTTRDAAPAPAPAVQRGTTRDFWQAL